MDWSSSTGNQSSAHPRKPMPMSTDSLSGGWPGLPGKAASFSGLLVRHVKKHLPAYLLVVVCYHLFKANYLIGWNETPSLPFTLFTKRVKGKPRLKLTWRLLSIQMALTRCVRY